MKKLMAILFIVLLFVGCGEDGRDGDAFIAFTWDWYVDSYTDNNSGVPYGITEYEYYEVEPGSYSYEYYCSDGLGNYWGYEGYYVIEINKGEEGGFLTDGEDGEDNYYRFDMSGSGTDFYLTKNKEKKTMLYKKNELDLSLYKKIPVGEVEQDVYLSGNGRMTVTKQRFQLIKK